MTLNQFLLLDEAEQLELLKDSVLLSDRTDAEHDIYLFQLHGFYVEVFYHKGYGTIKNLKAFASTDKLDPYLEKMEIKI